MVRVLLHLLCDEMTQLSTVTNWPNHSNQCNSSKTKKTVVNEEVRPLFFVDNTPSTDFIPPIYNIDSEVSTSETNDTMAPVRNIRIKGPVSFTNKENRGTVEQIFEPNPLLSSTRVNDSVEEIGSILTDHNVSMPPEIHISINSSCETGQSRKITVNRPSPKPSSPTIVITNNSKNNKSHSIGSPTTSQRKASKRKADSAFDGKEPPQKKNTSEVIVLNDTVLDVDPVEEDSVVFVSETMVIDENRHEILARPNNRKAAEYISIQGNSKNLKSPQSVRAKRRMEKKKRSQMERAGQAKRQQIAKAKTQQNSPKTKHAPNGVNNLRYRNRFVTNAPSTSFGNPSLKSSTAETEGKNAAAEKLAIKSKMQQKLFKEKPELFEKRMIIIDGSNVARSHGIINRSYSIKGIELCMKHFESLGFTVKAVVPQMRLKRSQSTDPDALERMANAGKIILTPCKNIPGNRSICYDDRFVLQAAELNDGAIISNDNFVDLMNEKEIWDEIIRERVVGFSWCGHYIMIPEDPYGRNGPSLQFILHKLKTDAKVDEDKKEAPLVA